ncbi:MAG: hypothetical protein J0M29_05150 [Chitinophagales bacterium]|nr:hypothetical protein [Chitinophagales bacterium]
MEKALVKLILKGSLKLSENSTLMKLKHNKSGRKVVYPEMRIKTRLNSRKPAEFGFRTKNCQDFGERSS